MTNTEVIAGPFAGVAALAGLAWLAPILRIDAFISPSGTGLIYVTATSRVSYGLARNRYFPQIFDRVYSNGVPWFEVLAAFVIGLFFLLPFPSWHSLVGLITAASVLMYAGGTAVHGGVPRPGSRRAPAVPDACCCGACPGRVRRRRPAHLLVGLRGDLEAWRRPGDRVRDHGHPDSARPAAAAAGLEERPVDALRVVGMGIISWQGQYSGTSDKHPLPPTNTFNIPFWWDILAVAGFSLIIWFWAMATKLPREEMLALVSRQDGEQELLDARHPPLSPVRACSRAAWRCSRSA